MDKAKSKYFGTAARMDEALIACLEKKDLEYITVKEICEKAGVNRSTFYLHYENIGDLLNECVEYTNNKCFQMYSSDLTDVAKRLKSQKAENIMFITPEYLRPYLEFIRQNRRLYRVVLLHQEIFRTQNTFSEIFNAVFSPAMDIFHITEEEKSYVVHFYLGGLTSLVMEWVKRDCADPVDFITDLCMRFILPDRWKLSPSN